jgi:hypothetical protein
MSVITICSSAAFYEHVIRIKQQLEAMGFEVLVPKSALKMAASGDYDVTHHKTWYDNPDDYHKKASLVGAHFDEVAKGDITLVVNDEKHGVPNYIGGNVLMEMALAFYLKKPIYLLHDMPAESPLLEEIIGVGSIPLKGDLSKLPSQKLPGAA